MNHQTIKLVSSFVTKNYLKLIIVSKHLFQQVKINNSYLEDIYNYIEDNGMENNDILRYFVKLYNELTKLNHKFSNSIFNRLHDKCYDCKFLNLSTIKKLTDIRLINKHNLILNYKRKYIEVFKHLLSIDVLNKNVIITQACRRCFLDLIKFLIEEMNVKLTINNSISSFNLHLIYDPDNNVSKYIILELFKTSVDLQELLYEVSSCGLTLFKYAIQESNIEIEYDTVERIILIRDIHIIKYLIEEKKIQINLDTFCKAIKAVKYGYVNLISYLYRKFNFDISGVRDELINYILIHSESSGYPSSTDVSSSDDETDTFPLQIGDKTIFCYDKRYDKLKFILEIGNKTTNKID